MHFTGSTDSMLIENFFYDTTTFVPAHKINFDSLSYMVDYLSTLYGRYPFWKEKYGVCYSTLGGGMEHQTMTTLGFYQTPLIAHELGHQWFGDHVTYKTWPHVWVSEGFATYTEQLYVAKFWGSVAAFNYRTAQYQNVMSIPGGRVYIDDTTSPYTLFDDRLVYNKGAGVVHMLRFLAPQDSLFFTVLKTYQQQYGFGNANTDDLKAIAASVYGQNLDTFFNQWIYEEGFPTYSAAWKQTGNRVYVQLSQTTSVPASVPVFFMPVELQFHSPQGDTTIKVFNNQASQLYSFTSSKTYNGMSVDSNNWIIHGIGNIVYDTTVHIRASALENIKVYPNPSKDHWNIDKLPEGTEMSVADMNGHVVWTGRATKTSAIIPGKQLPSGNYILQLKTINGDTLSIALVHW
jgi:aminopeptidase N